MTNSREEVPISTKYQNYQKTFQVTRSKVQSIRNVGLGRIKIVEPRKKLSNPAIALVHAALDHASAKTQNLKKAEIVKMFAESIMKPPPAEQAAQISFVSRKD